MISLKQRQEAREAVQHPGKYEGEHPMVPLLHQMDPDEEADLGDGEGYVCYYMRIGKWILHEDNFGFVTGNKFDSIREAQKKMTYLGPI